MVKTAERCPQFARKGDFDLINHDSTRLKKYYICTLHKMIGYIYKYTFPDGKIYIGQTRRPIKMRHAEHINPSIGPMNPGFWDAYQKLGMPELTILEEVEMDELSALIQALNNKETEYIRREKASDPNLGYNRMGHATVYIPDEKVLMEEYKRLCKIAEEENKQFFDSVADKFLNARKKEMTEGELAFFHDYVETNNPFSEYVTTRKSMEPIIDDDTDFFIYEALDYAEWRFNAETQEVIAHYVSENADAIIRNSKKGVVIQQIDKAGSIVREFQSPEEIREALQIIRLDNIVNVLKGRQKTAYGFYWRYKPVEE